MTVTVLLAVHKGDAYLEDFIESLVAQTHDDWRLDVLDDHASDQVRSIIEAWQHKDSRIGAIQQADSASSANRIAANYLGLLKQVDTTHFAFADEDDVWHREKLERQLDALAEVDPQTPALVFCDIMPTDETLHPTPPTLSARMGYRGPSDFAFGRLLIQNQCAGTATLGNRALARLVTANPPDVEDIVMHDWWCALVANVRGALIGLDWTGVFYRQHDRNALGAPGSGGKGLARFLLKPSRFRDRTRHLLMQPARQAIQLGELHGQQLTTTQLAQIDALALVADGLTFGSVIRCWRIGIRLKPLRRQVALAAGTLL